jgi:hypothetical protein
MSGEQSSPPELGYTPPRPGDEFGYWTFRVNGGPAFGMNAALACRLAERRGMVGADLFRRLADAIEAAMDE